MVHRAVGPLRDMSLTDLFNPHHDERGRFTHGAGGPSGGANLTPEGITRTQLSDKPPVRARDVDHALAELAKGNKVELAQVEEVSTLLDRLNEKVQEAAARGEEADNIDLCDVSVAGTNLFCGDSLGLRRAEMPQLSGEPRPGSWADVNLPKNERGRVNMGDAFRAHIESSGTTVRNEEVDPSLLRPTQGELNGQTVARMKAEIDAGGYTPKAVFVSSDNYIVDGHHGWAANIASDAVNGRFGDLEVDVMRVDAPILDLLGEAHTFSAERGLGPVTVAQGHASVTAAAVPLVEVSDEPAPSKWEGMRAALHAALVDLEAEAQQVVSEALAPVMERFAAAVPGMTAAGVDELTSILDAWGAAVDERVLPYYRSVFEAGGYSALHRAAELGVDLDVDDVTRVLSPYMEDATARHLATARPRFLTVGDKAWTEARQVMLDGVDQGQSLDTIARNMRGVTDVSQAQAMMVARTEVVSAANAGALTQANLLGADAPLYKQWLATMDDRTRPDHVDADGQIVAREAAFSVGGHALQYPGDPAGPSEQVIMCRCSIVFTDDPEGEFDVVADQVAAGRVEQGVQLTDVAPMEVSLGDIRDAMDVFDQIPVPTVARTATKPSSALVEWELARWEIGKRVDDLVRQRVGMVPEPPPFRSWTREAQAQASVYGEAYNEEMRRVLSDLGVDWGPDESARAAAVVDDLADEVRSAVHAAQDRLPRKWNDHMVSFPVQDVVVYDGATGAYFPATRTIRIPAGLADNVEVYLHEMNHHLAATRPGIHESEWVEKWVRETSLGTWDTVQNFGESDVYSRPDYYPSSYMGRTYRPGRPPSPSPNGRDHLTEVHTATIEVLLSVFPTQSWAGRLYADTQLRAWSIGLLATL